MQELIGNMTPEQFSQFIGVLFGCIIFFFGSCLLVTALVHAVVDGWLFRKGALYYGSLRYLNKCFKNLKTATSNRVLDIVHVELMSTIHLLRYQRIIPKKLYIRLLNRCYEINVQRREELFELEVLKK